MKISSIAKVSALCTVLFLATGCVFQAANMIETVARVHASTTYNESERGCVFKKVTVGLEWVCPGDEDEEFTD